MKKKKPILLPLTSPFICGHSESDRRRSVGEEEGIYTVPEGYRLSREYKASLVTGTCEKCNEEARNRIIETAHLIDTVVRNLKCGHCGKKV